MIGSALAQSTEPAFDPRPTGFNFRVGYLLPLYQALKDLAPAYGAIGIDYSLGRDLKGENFLAFDYFARSLRTQTGSNFSLTYNIRRYLKGGSADPKYWVVGIGASNQNFTTGSIVFSGRYGVGMDIGARSFAEIVGTYSSPGRDRIQGNTMGIYFGVRY